VLAGAGGGEDQELAGAQEIGVAQLGVGLGDARPGGGAAEVRSGELPERVAAVDGDAGGLHAGTKLGCGDNEHGAGLEMEGIGDRGVGGEEIAPARAAAEMAAGEFPEGVAGLDADLVAAEMIDGRSCGRVGRSERGTRGNGFCGEQQFWSGGGRRRGVDCGSAGRWSGERDGRPWRRGEIWSERRAFAGERGRETLAGKWVAARWRDFLQRLCRRKRMRIWRDQWRDYGRGGFHGGREGRLRKIHREARGGRLLRGFGGLGVFEFLAAVTAGDFSQTFGSGIFLGVDGGIGWSGGRCGRIIFAGFDLGAIVLGEDLRLLQIFVGVDMGIFFLLRGFAGFFLTRSFGDGLRIGLRILGAGRQRKQGSGRAETESYAEAKRPAGGPSR